MTSKETILDLVAYDKAHFHENQNPIYIILMLSKPGNEEIIYNTNGAHTPSGIPDYGHSDEVGFYYEIDTAITAITENWCDIQEHVYQAAFLLCRFPGLYDTTTTDKRMYFLWNKDEQKFIQQEEPVLFKHIGL